jgi:hypothetical protein
VPDQEEQRQAALRIHEEAISSLSVTRDEEVEITSARQLRILEGAAWKILSLPVDDRSVTDSAQAMLTRVAFARRWTWVDPLAAMLLATAALLIGIGAAVLAGTGGNIILGVVGCVASSALLSVVVLRYRRQNWRVRAERIAPMIWRHGA